MTNTWYCLSSIYQSIVETRITWTGVSIHFWDNQKPNENGEFAASTSLIKLWHQSLLAFATFANVQIWQAYVTIIKRHALISCHSIPKAVPIRRYIYAITIKQLAFNSLMLQWFVSGMTCWWRWCLANQHMTREVLVMCENAADFCHQTKAFPCSTLPKIPTKKPACALPSIVMANVVSLLAFWTTIWTGKKELPGDGRSSCTF